MSYWEGTVDLMEEATNLLNRVRDSDSDIVVVRTPGGATSDAYRKGEKTPVGGDSGKG